MNRNKELTVNILTLIFLLAAFFSSAKFVSAAELKVVQLYKQDELLNLIKANKHLDRVRDDNCQLVQDIQARADKMKVPAYQFLWGDMLAWGVCVEEKNVELGFHYMMEAAKQGLPEGLEQLGRYYQTGTLVQPDMHRAIIFTREAASLGNLRAQVRFAKMLLDGHGSPWDFEDAYHWLHNSVTSDKATHTRISSYLADLGKLMHPKAIRRAKRALEV